MDLITYKKRLWLALLILSCGAISAGASWFCKWDRVALSDDDGYSPARTTQFVVHAASSIGLFDRESILGQTKHEAVSLMLVSLLASSFLLAPILASTLSLATLLRVIWICLDLCLLLLLIRGWIKDSEGDYRSYVTFGMPLGHACFLPGFYLACLAALLHFTGLLLIPSAKPLDAVLPAE